MLPTNGSVAILNANAEKGSSSDAFLESSVSLSSEVPLTSSTSSGEGKKSITASNIVCTPLFLKAAPQRVTTNSFSNVLNLKPSLIS